MEIKYEFGPGGNCPVQAEGFIDGHPFYFRSRGEEWAIYISRTYESDFNPFTSESWKYCEPYLNESGECVPYMAGWAKKEECKAFIEKAAKIYIEDLYCPHPKLSQSESNCPKSLTDPYDTIEQQDFIQKGKQIWNG